MNVNPVLMKELKTRMRTWRAAGVILLYVAVLTLVIVMMTYQSYNNVYATTIDPYRSMGTYINLALIQFVLILFVAPALTAGAISGEREKQTLDLLISTKLSTRSIVLGKLMASMSQVILLIIATIPFFSIVFLFGGISFKELAQLFIFYVITAIAAGSIGIFFSCYMKRTTAATVLTYVTGAFMILGTILIYAFYMSVVIRNRNYNDFFPLLYTNPLVGFGSLLSGQLGGYNDILRIISINNVNNSSIFKNIAPWIVNLGFDIILTIVMLLLSARKINPIKASLFGDKWWSRNR